MASDVLRVGKVSSVNVEEGKCRVVYSDRDNCTTVELPLMVYNNEYSVPMVDDQVVVAHMPNGPSKGFILGDFWSKTHKTPEHTGDGYRRKDFDRDGNCFWEFLGDGDGSVALNNNKDVKIESSDGKITVKGKSEVEIASDGTVTIRSGGAITIEGSNISITGNVSIDGIMFSTHTHNCTAPGSLSGPPA